jgi:hypothetical protein
LKTNGLASGSGYFPGAEVTVLIVRLMWVIIGKLPTLEVDDYKVDKRIFRIEGLTTVLVARAIRRR